MGPTAAQRPVDQPVEGCRHKWQILLQRKGRPAPRGISSHYQREYRHLIARRQQALLVTTAEVVDVKRPGGEQRLQAVAEYGRRHYSIDKHCEQVASLALMLFDQLQAVLAMAGDDRFLLNCAALLHDIGWNDGQRGHHKRAAGMILKALKHKDIRLNGRRLRADEPVAAGDQIMIYLPSRFASAAKTEEVSRQDGTRSRPDAPAYSLLDRKSVV